MDRLSEDQKAHIAQTMLDAKRKHHVAKWLARDYCITPLGVWRILRQAMKVDGEHPICIDWREMAGDDYKANAKLLRVLAKKYWYTTEAARAILRNAGCVATSGRAYSEREHHEQEAGKLTQELAKWPAIQI